MVLKEYPHPGRKEEKKKRFFYIDWYIFLTVLKAIEIMFWYLTFCVSVSYHIAGS